MALPRTLEPEVMDTDQEARDYDAMDHSEVNDRFCDDLLAVCPSPGRVLDVGTGTALIPITLCRKNVGASVEAIDLASHMLALAERNVARASMGGRIHVSRRDAKATGWGPGSFDTVISNSIVHHIPEPKDVLAEVWTLVRPGGRLFVRDLVRPADDAEVNHLVSTYAAIPAGLPADTRARHERQRDLLEASLRAALTVDEVRAIVVPLGIAASAVTATSDRHWTLSCAKP
jgi:2-polyprenyl-3-methyl-5-hydroxy-6-metoxy-1,4-benzoquinol methylase